MKVLNVIYKKNGIQTVNLHKKNLTVKDNLVYNIHYNMIFKKKANWYQNNFKKHDYFIGIFAVEITHKEIQYIWQDELLDKCTVNTMGLQLTSNLRVLLVLSPTG